MSRAFSTVTPLGEFMALQGWTAKDFAIRTGIYPRTLTEYLSGRKSIPYHHLLECADALQVDMDLLTAD